jgi:putative ABC transport system permease protein
MLSLALAIGACTSAFRLIDAILLRPLPVAAPEQLYSVLRQVTNPADDRQHATSEVWAYPDFQLMRSAAKGQAELLAVSSASCPRI